MKSIFKQDHSFPTWLSALGLIVTITALYVASYIDSINSSHYSGYDSQFDSPERILQHVSCPSLMVQGEAKEIHAVLSHHFPNESLDVSFTMDAPDFLSDKSTETWT